MVASYEKSNQMPLKKPEKLYQLACYSQVLQKKKKRYLDQVSHSKLTAPEVMLVFEKNIVLSLPYPPRVYPCYMREELANTWKLLTSLPFYELEQSLCSSIPLEYAHYIRTICKAYIVITSYYNYYYKHNY